MMKDALFATLITMIGVLLGIKAVYGGIRLDWPETVLVVGIVLITVGAMKLFQTIKGGNDNELF
jgi:type IV secretory pathway VirB2 component (pilin)